MDAAEDSLYALSWSFFEQNLKTTFTNTQSLERYADVTFLCQDKTLHAHKIILHAGSEYFREVFEDRRAVSNNMLIYMYHVKGIVLEKLLEYLYCGEVYVEMKYLQDFIMLGQNLKVKGLVNHPKDIAKPEKRLKTKKLQLKHEKFNESPNTSVKNEKNTQIPSQEVICEINLNEKINSDSEWESKDNNDESHNTTNPLEEDIMETDDCPGICEKLPTQEEEPNSLLIDFRSSPNSSQSQPHAPTKRYRHYQRLTAKIHKSDTGQHEMQKGTRRRCAQCSIKKLEKRTPYHCTTCNIALCRECFQPFHREFSGDGGVGREVK